MANLRFSRSEEEGDIVFAQVSDSAGGDVVLDAIWIRTDWRVWFQSQYAFVKGTGAAHVADSAANEGDLFDPHCSLANEVISTNRSRTLLFPNV